MRILGPGIVTGAADDDPSGIATYAQAGAQFGFMAPWTMLFTYPLMTAVQEACMRIGAVTGKGLAAVIRENYSRAVLYPVLLLVVAANTLNIGSDIGAMAASIELIFPQVPLIGCFRPGSRDCTIRIHGIPNGRTRWVPYNVRKVVPIAINAIITLNGNLHIRD